MTKRLASKHKVDRRLKVNLWGRPKSPFNSRNYPPGQHGKVKKGRLLGKKITDNLNESKLLRMAHYFQLNTDWHKSWPEMD